MAKNVGENQIHEITLTMPYDLSGQTLTVVYVDDQDHSTTTGGAATGDSTGNDVVITTDLAAQSITPGLYDLEVRYDDSGTTRQLTLDGEEEVYVLDAQSV